MKLFDTISAKCMAPSAKNHNGKHFVPKVPHKGQAISWYPFLILFFSLFSFSLQSCSDDESEFKINNNPTEITLNVRIAEPVVTTTRAENDVNSLKLYVFDAAGETCYLTKDFSNVTNGSSLSITLYGDAQNATKLRFYAVANVDGLPDNPSSIADITEVQGKEISGEINSDSYPMNFDSTIDKPESSVTINLTRAIVKMSIQEVILGDYTVTGFQLRNIANKGYAGAKDDDNFTYSFNEKSPKINVQSSEDVKSVLFYPSKSESKTENSSNAYIIIEAEKEDIKYYYRVPVNVTNGNSSQPSNLLANHHYEIEVTSITGEGYTTAEEAVRHPEQTSITTKIHDHVAEVYSMVSDGTRELGTRETVNMTADSYDLFVKIFTPNEAEYVLYNNGTNPNGLRVTITEGDDWLKITNPTRENDPKEWTSSGDQDGNLSDGTTSQGNDKDDQEGKKYKYILEFKNKSAIYSDKSAKLEVTWQGLRREVNVEFEADFKVSEISTSTLTITSLSSTGTSSTNATIEDYWSFLNNTYSTKLFGATSNDLADDKNRSNGFHFPMPYGDSPKNYQWEYSYKINFDKLDKNNGGIKSITSSIKGDSYITKYVECIEAEGDGAIQRTVQLKSDTKAAAKSSYTYATGSVTFTINYNKEDSEPTVVTIYIYHTGFFDDQTNSTSLDQGYYYYEVHKMGNYYWLDRNVGAKSNKPYSEYASGSNSGYAQAKGLYYKAASKDPKNNKVIFDESMCPKGYRLPTATEWDNLRTQPKFVTTDMNDETTTSMKVTMYDTGNDEAGNIYFPKARYREEADVNVQYSSHANVGDDAAGYYWTRSEAGGLEKDEIGKWVRVMNMSGSSNNYIYCDVTKHLMNIRCVANNVSGEETKTSIEFNVKGATHVYLYSVDENGKSGIFTFPGKAIGSQAAVDKLIYTRTETGSTASDGTKLFESDNSYLHFAYSSTIPEENLFVFFAYREDTGKITMITENGATSLEEAEGWPVYIGYNYFFYGQGNDSSDHSNYDPEKTRIFPADGSIAKEETAKKFKKGERVRIHWPKYVNGINKDVYKIYAYNSNGTDITSKGGVNQNEYFENYGEYDEGEAFGYDNIILNMDCDFFYVKFIDGNGNATQGFQIKETGTGNVRSLEEINKEYKGSPKYWMVIMEKDI